MNDTILIDSDAIVDTKYKEALKSICEDLEERGYDPIKQIAGYIISGDPGYISSYKECRTRLISIDRTSLVEVMLTSYIK